MTRSLFPSFAHLPGAGASKAFRRIMERAGVAAGIARQAAQGSAGRNVSARSFHSLRHTFVTALSHANVAVELRKQLAGHSSEAQSLHYTHPEFAALRAADREAAAGEEGMSKAKTPRKRTFFFRGDQGHRGRGDSEQMG